MAGFSVASPSTQLPGKGLGLAAALWLAAIPCVATPAGAASLGDDAAGAGAFRHLEALQAIAAAHGGNRAAGTEGFDRSADYVAEQLKAAGYAVRLEEFDFPFFEERTPPILRAGAPSPGGEAPPDGPVRTLANSGSGDVTAPLRAVRLGLGAAPPTPSTSGCDAADFAGFARGDLALVRRGTCTFQVKVENAVAAGAVGVVIMNEGTPGRTDVFSGDLVRPPSVPVVGISYELGGALERRAGAMVHLAVDAVSGRRQTHNVLAEAPGNNDGARIVVGAHLDSVPAGPGINDNGSGTAAVLEAALKLSPQRRGAIRFAFWGAEERGLIGSRHHVGALSEEARRRIGVYINLDMVGSPNFVRFVQRSAATSELADIARRELLAEIHDRDLAVEESSGGRYGTDSSSFSEKSIPTVGLYTGAGAAKSEAEARSFGGTAGQPYDACYHRACDTTANIDRELLEANTGALMRALTAVTAAAANAR